MLKRLTITQFVIIEKLSIDFQAGLTVLTGETGAGKSILLDALGLALGDPPDREAIRLGCEESIIEAEFIPPATHPVRKFLETHGVMAPDTTPIQLKRTTNRAEKDEIIVNGKSIELPILKELGLLIVEIHGQFASQNLHSAAYQMGLLDAFGAYPPEVLGNVSQYARDVIRITKELDDESMFLAKKSGAQMALEQLVSSLESLEIKENAYEDTLTEFRRLTTAKEVSEIFNSIHSQLVASFGAENSLMKANQIVKKQQTAEGEGSTILEKLSDDLASALKATRDSIAEMERLAPEYDIDISALGGLNQKLMAFRKIASDHKIEPSGTFKLYQESSVELARIRNGRNAVVKLDHLLAETKNNYHAACKVLTEARLKASKAMNAAINAELPPLKLARAEFNADVIEKFSNTWDELGCNQVTFTARMNPGMPFSPVSKTASGGEFSRVVLALKLVLQPLQSVTTLVFDELDSGIGGAAAAAVGERIAHLADAAQVLVITHSPQVASRGNNHMHVSKKSDGKTTSTVVSQLTHDERLDEISRMLAGDTITAESHAAAKSLIDEASKAASSRQEQRSLQ